MTFKTPCFVRVENAEERENLMAWCLGMGYRQKYENLDEATVVVANIEPEQVDSAIDDEDVTDGLSSVGLVDCGTDVELFKALAAMNQENDREQWFTNGNDWCLCHDDIVTKMVIPNYALYHKATAAEIVEHFKNKKQ